MPQFDKITFFNQVFWLFFFFSGFYLIFLKTFLPKLSSVLKVRIKKLQKGSSGVDSFLKEQTQVIDNFNFSLEQIFIVIKNSVFGSIEKMNFWIKLNYLISNKGNFSLAKRLHKVCRMSQW
jgi:hypothetical protein